MCWLLSFTEPWRTRQTISDRVPWRCCTGKDSTVSLGRCEAVGATLQHDDPLIHLPMPLSVHLIVSFQRARVNMTCLVAGWMNRLLSWQLAMMLYCSAMSEAGNEPNHGMHSDGGLPCMLQARCGRMGDVSSRRPRRRMSIGSAGAAQCAGCRLALVRCHRLPVSQASSL